MNQDLQDLRRKILDLTPDDRMQLLKSVLTEALPETPPDPPEAVPYDGPVYNTHRVDQDLKNFLDGQSGIFHPHQFGVSIDDAFDAVQMLADARRQLRWAQYLFKGFEEHYQVRLALDDVAHFIGMPDRPRGWPPAPPRTANELIEFIKQKVPELARR